MTHTTRKPAPGLASSHPTQQKKSANAAEISKPRQWLAAIARLRVRAFRRRYFETFAKRCGASRRKALHLSRWIP